ncbi:MAG: Nif11-like leader peptide family natural product precursor [Snowella sp.]|nr:MAG: Nif11-like leader peptide family natural product precursor [Snowella sp.]
MINRSVEEFYQVIKNSEELQQQLANTQDQDSFNDLAVELGKQNGYDFTAEEVNSFVKFKSNNVNVELQDEDLALVAGAKRKSCPLNTSFTACFIRSGCWGSKC